MHSIALDFDTLLSDDWEKNWQQLDRDQMIEILKCNNLRLSSNHQLKILKEYFNSDEFKLWEAFLKWIQAPNHPERRGNTSSPLLTLVLPLIRFPHMSPDELSQVEKSSIAELHPKLFLPSLMLAYKYQALPIASRTNCKCVLKKVVHLFTFFCFQGVPRQTVPSPELRWHPLVQEAHSRQASGSSGQRWSLSDGKVVCVIRTSVWLQFLTKSSTYPVGEWKWTVRLCGILIQKLLKHTNWVSGSSYDSAHHDVLRIKLIAEEIDQPRWEFDIVSSQFVLFQSCWVLASTCRREKDNPVVLRQKGIQQSEEPDWVRNREEVRIGRTAQRRIFSADQRRSGVPRRHQTNWISIFFKFKYNLRLSISSK